MKRLVQIAHFPEVLPLPVMKHVFTEFAEAFTDYGCTVRLIESWQDLEDGGIILIDDAAGNYEHNKEVMAWLAARCPTSIFICWYWSNQTIQPFWRMIHTGELHLHPDHLTADRRDYMSWPTFVPLALRANDAPERIGTYPRHVVHDYCFMGGGYKKKWVPTEEFHGIYHQVKSTNYLSYAERKQIYLSSMFAFGFQSPENIHTGHLSQRIFEGLAYGCIVLCENKLAEEFTNGAVVYVATKEDLVEKMRFYKAHPELVEAKQKQGYEWVKQFGTNRHSVLSFLNKIKELYQEEFEIVKDTQSKEFLPSTT